MNARKTLGAVLALAVMLDAVPAGSMRAAQGATLPTPPAPTAAPLASPLPFESPAPSTNPSAAASPSPTESPSPTASPSPAASPSPTTSPSPTASPTPAKTATPTRSAAPAPTPAPTQTAAPAEQPPRNYTVLYISIGASIVATIVYALVNSRQTKMLPPTTATAAPKSAGDAYGRIPKFSFHLTGSNEMVRGLFGTVVRLFAKGALQSRQNQNRLAPGKP